MKMFVESATVALNFCIRMICYSVKDKAHNCNSQNASWKRSSTHQEDSAYAADDGWCICTSLN
jgi:hypothetical protein